MSLSRLSGLVVVLVLGTALSVWWYLQVPVVAAAGPIEAAVDAVAEPGPAVDLHRSAPALAGSERWTTRTRNAPARKRSTETHGWGLSGASSGSTGTESEPTDVVCPASSAPDAEPAPAAAAVPGQT